MSFSIFKISEILFTFLIKTEVWVFGSYWQLLHMLLQMPLKSKEQVEFGFKKEKKSSFPSKAKIPLSSVVKGKKYVTTQQGKDKQCYQVNNGIKNTVD